VKSSSLLSPAVTARLSIHDISAPKYIRSVSNRVAPLSRTTRHLWNAITTQRRRSMRTHSKENFALRAASCRTESASGSTPASSRTGDLPRARLIFTRISPKRNGFGQAFYHLYVQIRSLRDLILGIDMPIDHQNCVSTYSLPRH